MNPSQASGPQTSLASQAHAASISDGRAERMARWAWWTLSFVLFVILFGAVVRITGSGAGCGQHWPSCNGEIAHLPRTTKTLIEYTHRLTSGASLFPVLALVFFAFRDFGKGHLLRKGALFSLVFLLIEALIGAALVRLGLVENDASAARAIVMPLHLVNTSALTAALVLTAWASREPSPTLRLPRNREGWLLALGLVLVLAVSITGAVTALGDTLYPVRSAPTLAAGLARDHQSGSHFLEQLRAVHPLLALATGAFLLYVPFRIREGRSSARLALGARAVLVCTLLQLFAGVANIWLSAPGFMQVLHLALANALWIALVWTWATHQTESLA
ncbi:MAG TPA: COX15/CtaA family protein [Polyangiaceae bacterium]|nr:COX15/CtaA family protein [Polyangiaceae bacterium]